MALQSERDKESSTTDPHREYQLLLLLAISIIIVIATQWTVVSRKQDWYL